MIMLEWSQNQIGRPAKRLYLRVLSWIYPDLKQIEDDDERMLTTMVKGERVPKWLNYLMKFLVCVVFPLIGALTTLYLAQLVRLPMHSSWRLLWFLGGWMGGCLIPLTAIVILQRPKYAQLIRHLHDLCPSCGYNLQGDLSRGCPECGWQRDGES